MNYFDEEKNLDTAATDLSVNDSDTSETINNSLTQNYENVDDGFDFFGEDAEDDQYNCNDASQLTEWQKVFQGMDVIIQNGHRYNAVITGIEFCTIKDYPVLEAIYCIHSNGLKKEVQNLYFLGASNYGTEIAIKEIKDFASKFGISLTIDDFKNGDSLEKALCTVVGTWVEIVPSFRRDTKTNRLYENYRVVNILGKNFELGGN